jgi:hypothetical protein
MPLSTVIILSVIVAMFAAFIGIIGFVSIQFALTDAREQAAARRREKADARTA